MPTGVHLGDICYYQSPNEDNANQLVAASALYFYLLVPFLNDLQSLS